MTSTRLLGVFLFTGLILLAIASYAVYKYMEVARALESANGMLTQRNVNAKMLLFTQLVLDKVLGASKEVSFDDRLQLENAVRDLQDAAVLHQWETFTGSKTQEEAQGNLRALLSILVRKIRVQ